MIFITQRSVLEEECEYRYIAYDEKAKDRIPIPYKDLGIELESVILA